MHINFRVLISIESFLDQLSVTVLCFAIIIGMASIEDLFDSSISKLEDCEGLKRDEWLDLYEKFAVLFKLNEEQVLIPHLLSDSSNYSEPTESHSAFQYDKGHRPLHRFWLLNGIPDGFWSRLICEVAKDTDIHKVSYTVPQGNLSKQIFSLLVKFVQV